VPSDLLVQRGPEPWDEEMSVLRVMRMIFHAAYLVPPLQPSPFSWVTLDGDVGAESPKGRVLRYMRETTCIQEFAAR
jgi:hypothetical protein